ncbi:MAG: M24 family metallopeptidase [Chthoniobacterales bacterium]
MSNSKTKTRLMVANSETDADMLYATKFFAPDPFVFLERSGQRTLLLSDLEIDRARRTAQADEFLPYSQFEKEVQGSKRQAPSYDEVVTHFLKQQKVKSALVPEKFPLALARKLEANKIRIEAAGERYWPERAAKTDAELRLLRKALEITEAGMARGIEVLKKSKPGKGQKLEWSGKVLTSEILRAEIDSAVLRAGGLPANTIVAGGDQACDPHERGHGPLKANSLIILDIFPRSATSGYYGDLTRTVLRGRASDAQRKLWDTVNAGQAIALKKMKPGVDGLKLHQEIKQFFADQGFPTEVRDGRQTGFFHGTGHGLGLEIHEYPRFQKTVFEAGQVITVEPGLYYPGLGGVRTEDVVALTKKGIRMLSRFRNELEL